ncbi:hypothetical protein [Streptomyces sudanensis]|uniref:hypothetical protein n=1 Tax=Streptomyces sudanensis TaxID=436397 RepID=UPI0020CBE5A9|nr:hypothetical protein [Streptomyces sudanensis]MCQ0002514.1 hypothetical protein [Streptomyces sudanensis]
MPGQDLLGDGHLTEADAALVRRHQLQLDEGAVAEVQRDPLADRGAQQGGLGVLHGQGPAAQVPDVAVDDPEVDGPGELLGG